MVPDAPDVETVALGPDGILAGARPGLIYVDMSTIDPLTTRRVGAAMAARGVRMIDCPVGRTTAHAEAGRLLLMLGGDPARHRGGPARPGLHRGHLHLLRPAGERLGDEGREQLPRPVDRCRGGGEPGARRPGRAVGRAHARRVPRRRWPPTPRSTRSCGPKALADDFTPGLHGAPRPQGPPARPGHGARLRRAHAGRQRGLRRLRGGAAGWGSSARTCRASCASGRTKPGSASGSRADDAAASAAPRAGAAGRERARLRGSAPGGTVPRGLGGGRRARRSRPRWLPASPTSTRRRSTATGSSEHRLGEALREVPRDAFVLSTKVGRLLRPTRGGPRRTGSSRMPFRSSTCTTTAETGPGARSRTACSGSASLGSTSP